jgi:hypothetical protein
MAILLQQINSRRDKAFRMNVQRKINKTCVTMKLTVKMPVFLSGVGDEW